MTNPMINSIIATDPATVQFVVDTFSVVVYVEVATEVYVFVTVDVFVAVVVSVVFCVTVDVVVCVWV
jgi:hypothetical protein